MGTVSRGLLAVIVTLVLAGGVTPVVAGGDARTAVHETDLVPRASPEDQRQPIRDDRSGDPIERSVPAEPRAEPLEESVASRLAAQDEDTIHLVQRFERLPERPGTVRVEHDYVLPDRIVSLRTAIPAEATLTDRSGFDRINDTHYEWADEGQQPTLTYELPINESVDRSDPQAASGDYVYVGTGDWALFQRPSTPTTFDWTGSEQPEFDRQTAIGGPGAAGEWIVYLGDYDVYERTAHEQEFRLVVPRAANMSESPNDVLDALTASSDALRVGDRDEEVFLVAAPTGGVPWGVRGLQTGDADIWVGDRERLDEPDSPWIHEYVHSRQSFTPTRRTFWLSEATATYYAALLSLEQENVEFDEFDERLRAGRRPVYNDTVLADTSTWRRSPDYYRGALVAGQLDRQLRVATDREQTLQYVFRTMNSQRGPVTQLDLLETLADSAGTDLLHTGQQYTETTENVGMWNRTTHAAVFGQLPARIGYQVPPIGESDAYRIGGPYRSVPVEESEPISLVAGERLEIHTTVNNVGGTVGEYNLSLRVNGTVVNETNGRIAASHSKSVPLSHTFPTSGRYAVSVEGETVVVDVERPADARVVGLSVDDSQLRQGEAVRLTATVYNDAERPGEMTVVFTRDFREVNRSRVTVPPNSSTFVSRMIVLPDSGTVAVSAGSARPIELSVEAAPARITNDETATATRTVTPPTSPTPAFVEATPTQSPETTTTSADGPGLGPPLVAVAVAAFLVARRYGPH